jgi:adenylate kinase
MMIWCFLGAPGVGKGTFAARVAKKLGIPTISTGDIIRGEIKNGTPLGNEVKAFSNSGKLVPDAIVTAMVKNRLSEPDAKKGFILDGYPRTIRQAQDLEEFQVSGS